MTRHHVPDSGYAWLRLAFAIVLMTIGGVGMYSVQVVLPTVQADFGVDRSAASFPYAMTMIGFGIGGILMGRLSDRHGIVVPIAISAFALAAGYFAAGAATSLWQFALAQAVLIALVGSSATFAPLVADTSLWFDRRRGIAIAICASGNYVAGALWPPVVQALTDRFGWRDAYWIIGVACLVTLLPLAFTLRERAPAVTGAPSRARFAWNGSDRPLGMSPAALQALLSIAGVACCVAMAMPQVHIVAYCSDLGYGAARGAQMMSLMLASGIVSRLASGWISDRIGGLRTLLLGSTLQAFALLLYMQFDGLASLYVISALFGLFQGGIIPSYPMIIREHFSPLEAGRRVGTVLMATLFGMALGGWMSGWIFDLTGSYRAAFVNGFAWNLVNLAIIAALLARSRRVAAPA